MNAVAKEVVQETKATAEVVTMSDGRKVEFAGKRKLLKETLIDEAGGTVSVRLDFRNGETRNFVVPSSLILRAAGHGIEQKLGDETASSDPNYTVEDAVMDVDNLIERLATKGLEGWTMKREGGGMAGTSVLLKAMVEFSGRTVEQVREFLKTKTQAEKMALRDYEVDKHGKKVTGKSGFTIKEIVTRLESEKRAKVANTDAGALLEGL